MAINVAAAPASLDVGTLFFVAICVTALLGLFLLFAWTQERIKALAWWGVAYLLGGASGALWRWGDLLEPGISSWVATTLLFVAVGMIWSAARLFHGRPVRRIVMLFGAAFWLTACFVPAFTGSAASRLVVSALIVAGYTILTAAELRLERRKSLIRRWPAIFVPILHGAIFLLPVALATLTPGEDGNHSLAQGWIVVFAIEIVLYLVGTAFIVLILAKDRTVNVYKTAASTDALTGVLNRRGFFEAASMFLARNRRSTPAVSVLAFDLDHFKLINDRCGHIVGDAVLELFRKARARHAAIERYPGPPRRRGIRGASPRDAAGGHYRRRARARRFRRGKHRSQRPADHGDGQYRRRERSAVNDGGYAHHAGRSGTLPGQGERSRPDRDRRADCQRSDCRRTRAAHRRTLAEDTAEDPAGRKRRRERRRLASCIAQGNAGRIVTHAQKRSGTRAGVVS